MRGGRAGRGGRATGLAVPDGELFDSFSESREGSAHSVKRAPDDSSSASLFQLLTDAANALRPPQDAGVAEAQQLAGAPAKPQPGAAKAAAANAAPPPPPQQQAQPAALTGGAGNGAADGSGRRLPSGHSPGQAAGGSVAAADRCSSASKSGSLGKSGPDWDSAQEASEDGGTPLPRQMLPAGMSRQQGSLASESMSSRLSSTAPLPSISGSVVTDEEVPLEAFYDACSGRGSRPSARWGHACAVAGDRLFVFGGTGRGCSGDCYYFDAARSVWAQVPGGREAPAPTFGAAACAAAGTVFVFGGKQSQRPCRRLHTLNPETLQWRAHKDSAAAPPAVADHSMTAVGRHGIYVWGGEGSRLSAQVYGLDPHTLAWRKVDTLGAVPPPRQGHTAVWDGADSLLIYGGHSSTRIFADVRVLSLSTGHWSEARCSGRAPAARHSHSACLVGANLMLVWGGCGERGAVLNDAFLLNTSTFVWHELRSIGSPPSGRYCHSCAVVARRVLLFGGTDARQAFDQLVTVGLDLGGQLNSLAQSLSHLSPALDSEGGGDLLRLQLGNHLRQRHAQETSQVAVTRAEIAERLFEAERQRSARLAAELQNVRFMLREEEGRRHAAVREAAAAQAAAKQVAASEGHRRQELQARLQAALATVQRQAGEAVAVDGYRAMYDRLVQERKALVERAVELEFENGLLRAAAAQQKAASAGMAAAPASRPSQDSSDAWAEEFDRREQFLQESRLPSTRS